MRSEKSIGEALNPEWVRRNEPEAPPKRKGRTEKIRDKEKEPAAPLERGAQLEHQYIVSEVAPGSAAAAAGLLPGDRILSIEGNELPPGIKLPDEVQTWKGEPRTLLVWNESGVRSVPLQPRWNEETKRWGLGMIYAPWSRFKETERADRQDRRIDLAAMPTGDGAPSDCYATVGPIESIPGQNVEYEAGNRREIKRLTLSVRGKSGEATEYDVIRRFNVSGVKVFWDPSLRDVDGVYDRRSNEVSVRTVSDPRSVHVLLHELRHAFQHSEGAFGALERHYESTSDEKYADDRKWDAKVQGANALESIQEILASVVDRREAPQLLERFVAKWGEGFAASQQAMDAFGNAVRDRFQAEERLRAAPEDKRPQLRKKLAKMKKSEESARAAVDRARQALPPADTAVVGSVTLRDIFRLPTLVLERDAEYGALVALRTIKKETKLDLLDRREAPPETAADERSDVKEGVIAGLTKKIDNLRQVESYMQRIGVPKNCLRELKNAAAVGETETA